MRTLAAGVEPVWEVTLQKRLQQGESRFSMSVCFKSLSKRLVLYGPSGSGKTQTLRMIAGISPPDGGRVNVAGRLLFDAELGVSLSPQARQLGYMFQDDALFPHLTVCQNIGFALQGGPRNPARNARDPRVESWIERFALQSVAHHFPHQISGGQRQRTALARALVREPTALLLDEPFAALDKRLRQKLREELLALQQQFALPLLLITHDDEDVNSLAEEVVTLEAGQVVST